MGLSDILFGRKKLKEPKGERLFALWNPPITDERSGALGSYMMVPAYVPKAPRTLDRPMNRTLKPIMECAASISKCCGRPALPTCAWDIAGAANTRATNRKR